MVGGLYGYDDPKGYNKYATPAHRPAHNVANTIACDCLVTSRVALHHPYDRKRSRVPMQLTLLLVLGLGVSTVVLLWKSTASAKEVAKLKEQLNVARLQADGFKTDLERNSVR